MDSPPGGAAHQAPPSLGFSRQEHWSGLPFPSPMHESEKWKWSRLVASDPQRPHGLQPTRLCCPWDFPGKSTGVGCHCLLRYVYIRNKQIQFQAYTHLKWGRFFLPDIYTWKFVTSLLITVKRLKQPTQPSIGTWSGHMNEDVRV